MTEKEFADIVNAHGHNFGYGRMMQIIANEWAKRDAVGALTVGPCKFFVNKHGDYHALLDKVETNA